MKSQSCSSLVTSVRVLRNLALALAVVFLPQLIQARPHKVRVSDPAAAAEMRAQGARLLADYGSFQLFETTALPTLTSAKGDAMQSADESDFIELNAGPLDTRATSTVALRKNLARFAGKKLHLLQFVGPIKPEWRATVEAMGVTIVHYVPQNAYLVRGDHAALTQLQAWAATVDFVQWDGEFATDYKVHPRARLTDASGNAIAPTTDVYALQLVDDAEANAATLALIDQLKLEPVSQEYRLIGYLNLVVRIAPENIAKIAAQPEVVSIRPYVQRKRRDERQGQIMAGNLSGNVPNGAGYLTWLASKGFTQSQFDASGFVVDVTDSGIDNGTTNVGHFGLYKSGNPVLGSRVAYSRLEGTANSGSTLQGCDGHGNLNSHIIAGFNDMTTAPHLDASGYHYGLGICPFVRVGSSVIFDTSNFTSPNYPNLASRAYRDGARVSNNSWGADTAGDYDADAQAYDALVRDAQPSGSSVAVAGNQQMVFCFAAGNAGSSAGTVGSPGTAKNVIVVGAAENVHSHATAVGGNSTAGNDGCTTPDTEANSANDIASFSSRGPCADGRQKPDLVAPGTHITGGVAQSLLTTNGTGAAISCFDGTGVCGLPGGGTAGSVNNFFPLGQQFYSTSSGTSHSTPGVAGACALLRQYFINASLTPPSPAMTKAFLVNAARYMTGTSAGDNLPSPNQGMGAVNLGTAFDGVPRGLRDQLTADKFTASGQTRTVTGSISDSSKPFRVSLAWTDAPGNTTGNAYNNDLDLTVTVGGNTYKGNVFSGGLSVTGGTADPRNNLESVFIPAGVSGAFSVTVTAANINSDGVPNEAPSLDQDFALVIYNGSEIPVPSISTEGYALVAESCSAPNNAVDPNETVTINLVLRNIGTANTTNLLVTLLPTNGVVSPSSAQNFGALVAGGNAVTQAFTFSASGVCGSNIVATFALTDNATSYGQTLLTIPLGQFVSVFAQNFDAVTAPALPAGWTSTGGGGQTAWVTTTASSDSAPNAVFSPDAATKGSNELVSATYALFPGQSQLSFRHRYGFEGGFDGGVLEIKIGSGAFTDIVTAGGVFVSGGYNATLNSGNALGARAGWSTTNNSFSTVVVNLPVSAAGQNVQFRWRSGTDSSVGGLGWWIDSVAVQSTVCCGIGFAPIITSQPANQSVVFGQPGGFSVSVVGDAPFSYQWFSNSVAIPLATNATYSIAAVTGADAGNYFVTVTNASGSVTSSVASLTVVVAPVILANPASLTVVTGSPAAFSVSAIGAAPLHYQWLSNGLGILDATNATYAIANAQTNDAASYSVIVTNFAGSVTSAPALLTVNAGSVGKVVISQIYGGGGNSGATYRNDYVELFNSGGLPASVNGWSVQYASASGTSWQDSALTGTIPAGGYYLIQLASGGAIGSLLPVANATNSINLSGSNGKLALVTNTTALSGANPVGGVAIADFVGYGTASAFEGSGAAPAGGNATAILRAGNGATDTDNNASDFATGTPNPRTSATTNPPVVVTAIDLAATLSHAGTFTQGDTGRVYTIVVTNVGSLASTGLVSVVDVLPNGLTATAFSGAGWTATLGTLTATRSDALATNAAYPPLTLVVSVATNAASVVTNVVTVSTGGDTNVSNDVARDVTTIAVANSGGSGSVYTGILAGWDVSTQINFGVSPLAATTNAPNITVTGLTRGSGVGTNGTAASGGAWGGNSFDAATAAASATASNFISFSVAANVGYKVSFQSVSRFDYRRSNTGPTNGVIQYQIGNGGFVDVATNNYAAGNSGFVIAPIDLSSIAALQNVSSGTNVVFRIVNYNTTGSAGAWYIYDVVDGTAPDFAISGIVSPLAGPAASAPTLTLLSLTNSQMQFTLNGTATSNYVIEVSTDLGAASWSPVYTGAAPILFTEPATNAQRYYRGKIAP